MTKLRVEVDVLNVDAHQAQTDAVSLKRRDNRADLAFSQEFDCAAGSALAKAFEKALASKEKEDSEILLNVLGCNSAGKEVGLVGTARLSLEDVLEKRKDHTGALKVSRDKAGVVGEIEADVAALAALEALNLKKGGGLGGFNAPSSKFDPARSAPSSAFDPARSDPARSAAAPAGSGGSGGGGDASATSAVSLSVGALRLDAPYVPVKKTGLRLEVRLSGEVPQSAAGVSKNATPTSPGKKGKESGGAPPQVWQRRRGRGRVRLRAR